MHVQPGTRRTAPALTRDDEQLIERVRHDGAYSTRERAEQAVRTVLPALGGQLGDELRAELATHLPAQAAGALVVAVPPPPRRTGWMFVQDIAGCLGVTPAVARWETGAVLTTVAALLPSDVLTRTLAELPPGYALLFGCAELVQAA